MNRMLFLLCALVPPLAACHQPAVATASTNNPHVAVETLLTHDGCTVYRFTDAQAHYFVRCDGAKSAATMSTVSCGKNCVRDETVQTLAKAP